MNRRTYPRINARCLPDGPWIAITGREAETFMLLASKGSSGLRAYDFPGGPPFRLSAYIFDLRGFEFQIRTDREDHAGGTHAVYVLECDVEFEVVALMALLTKGGTQAA